MDGIRASLIALDSKMELALPPVRCFHRRLASIASPLSLFERLYGGDASAFLYESLEAHGGRGRYSFLGGRPRAVFRAKGHDLTLEVDGRAPQRMTGNPLEALRCLLKPQPDAPPVAPFCGGAVGYIGYDAIRWIERIPCRTSDELGLPDAHLLFPREVICFDHLEKVVHVLLYMENGQDERLAQIRAALRGCDEANAGRRTLNAVAEAGCASSASAFSLQPSALHSNMSREQFCEMVHRAQQYILAGDIFQVVLSQRFSFDLSPSLSPLDIYKSLRVSNPSPYMYYLKLDDLHIAGSSPEILTRLSGRKAVTRPLAGTRRRGETAEEDARLEAELRADPKERAEHVMLVDLGRNDLGRVCEFGSVNVTDVLDVERHRKVMHLVSNVEGWLREDRDALDLFTSTFPAGTVSGAPKVRAMEIIDELEPTRRGIYAGAIGYFSLLGDVDLCIAIRTIVMKGSKGYIQAGAGIVADSLPDSEYEETLNKARALIRAVEMARAGNRDSHLNK